MRHIIVTRACFTDDALFQKYFRVIESVYIPCLLSQTTKNFEVYVTVSAQHAQQIQDAGEKHGLEIRTLVGTNANTPYKEIVKSGTVVADIQTRHDCDDWMGPQYVEKIQAVYNKNIDKIDEFLIQAQPTKLKFGTDEEYTVHKYSSDAPSMFLSLCQSASAQKSAPKTIFDANHGAMSKLVPKVFNLGPGLVKWVVHGNNILAQIRPNEVPIGRGKVAGSDGGYAYSVKSLPERLRSGK